MVKDVREACQNMNYLGMSFDLEEIVNTISDPSFKAWQAQMKGVQFVDRHDLKESNTKVNANVVTSNRSNKDVMQVAQGAKSFGCIGTSSKN